MTATGCQSGSVTRVLVVEDDRELGELLLRAFGNAGYSADLAPDGQAGLHRALTRRYDLLVVDRGLPAIEGLDLIGRLRRSGVDAPALVLTALGTVADRVAGLDGGAEDYVVKPFDLEELMARVRAQLRRPAQRDPTRLEAGGIAVDLHTREVIRLDRSIHVSHQGVCLPRPYVSTRQWPKELSLGQDAL